jgi:poly(hydroxyalkanoate) depolymerase family esterase
MDMVPGASGVWTDAGVGSAGHVAPKREALPQGALFLEKTFANLYGRRSYKLYVPSHYQGQQVPLLVMLHGCTQSPNDFAAGTQMNEVAEERTCLVAYPAQAKAANISKCWNWFLPEHQQRETGEPSLIAGIARQVMAEYAVDPARLYIAGLSAGGAAAANMASLYPDLFAAVGVHSGLVCGAAGDLPSAFAAMKQGSSRHHVDSDAQPIEIPVIVFHGDQDCIVNHVNADQVAGHASLSRFALRSTVETGVSAGGRRYTVARQIDAEERVVVEQWSIHGAGHAWSGGRPSGSYTDPAGPDASREMVRFFLSHRRKEPGGT